MDWVPTHARAWLMHCHMIPHITPVPPRSDSAQTRRALRRHPFTAMAGLVLGITSVERSGAAPHVLRQPIEVR